MHSWSKQLIQYSQLQLLPIEEECTRDHTKVVKRDNRIAQRLRSSLTLRIRPVSSDYSSLKFTLKINLQRSCVVETL